MGEDIIMGLVIDLESLYLSLEKGGMMVEEHAGIYRLASIKDASYDLIDVPEGKNLCADVLLRRR